MIQYLDPERFYTNRTYLTQWFCNDVLVVTDNDFENITRTQHLLQAHSNANRILDITHNPWPDYKLPFRFEPTLTNNFDFWYKPTQGSVFFPIWLWMYSLRNPQWWDVLCFDAGPNKTQEVMCLNNRRRPHRTKLWAEFNRVDIIDQMVYSFAGPDSGEYSYPWPLLLSNETVDPQRNDVGVGHPAYHQCAVNVITETATDLSYVSEKVCKAFVARQIPVIVGSAGINQFLQDIGLDMFGDIVPWATWDNEPNEDLRIAKIAEFVTQWIRSKTILSDYQRALSRVEQNKRYFHSETFRTLIMQQMDRIKL